MIPFPGESVLVSDAYDDTDGTLPSDIVYRAGSRDLSSGHEWRMFVYSADMDYAEGPLDATVQWAVEVLGGTVTVEAREGVDPTYGDTGMVLPIDLGTHTFTGPGTFLIDSTFTADQVADLDGSVSAAFQLGLTAITGTAEVQQIKMRVWPVGGARGAFVKQSGYDTDPEMASVWRASDSTARGATLTTAGAEDSWYAAHAALSSTSGPYEFTPLFTSGSSPHYENSTQYEVSQSNMGGGLVQTAVNVGSMVAMVIGVDWSAQHPVGPLAPAGYIRPPTEVRDENVRVLFPQIGTGSTGWVDAMATLVMTGLDAASVPAVTFISETGPPPTPEITGPTSYMVDINVNDDGIEQAVPAAGETLTTGAGLSTDGRYLFVHVSHTAAKAVPLWPGVTPGSPTDPAVKSGVDTRVAFGQGDPDGLFDPIKTYARMPDYRVWYPDAVPETPTTKLRQYHRDDGLGVAPRRAYGGASRNHTRRAYGYT